MLKEDQAADERQQAEDESVREVRCVGDAPEARQAMAPVLRLFAVKE